METENQKGRQTKSNELSDMCLILSYWFFTNFIIIIIVLPVRDGWGWMHEVEG